MTNEERERLLDLLNLKDERIAQLEEALRSAHQLLEVISIDSRYPSLGVSVRSFLRRERAALSNEARDSEAPEKEEE